MQNELAHSRTVNRGIYMIEILRKAIVADSGLTTAEYAVGTIAAAGLGGVLLKLLTNPEVQDLIWKIIQQAFNFLFLG
jgi:hypothetical protein